MLSSKNNITSKKNIIAKFFQEETQKSNRAKNVNPYMIYQLKRQGKELEAIGDKKNQGVSVINPVKYLLKNGKIGKSAYYAALAYQICYEKSIRTNHARPKYDDTSRNVGAVNYEPNQDQIDSSRRVKQVHDHFESQFKTIINGKTGRISIKISYLALLRNIIEKEKSIRTYEAETKINRNTLTIVLMDLCEKLVRLK